MWSYWLGGNKHIYQNFLGHLICISFSNLLLLLFFFFSLYPFSFGHSNILFACGMVCLIPYFYLSADFFLFSYILYMFLGLGQEAWPPCLLGAFSCICLTSFFLNSSIVHVFEFRARSMPPLSFGIILEKLLIFFFFFSLTMCTYFWVWGKKHSPLVFWEYFCFHLLAFSFLCCVHAFGFRARSTTPFSFGSLGFKM